MVQVNQILTPFLINKFSFLLEVNQLPFFIEKG